MKRILSLILVAAIAFNANAQLANPVSWNYTIKKVADKTYEVRLTANIESGWHLFSQTQPDDAIAIPTDIVFNINPLLTLDGKPKELGKMEKFKDKSLGISANQYSKKVEFVQKIKLRGNVKTNITGTVEYQTCDDTKCLPPKKINFSLQVQ